MNHPQNTPAGRIGLLRTMMRIRGHEERLAALASPSTPGTCTSVGQEACAAGVVAALRPEDRILSNHRSAGHLLARGAEPDRLMAEVLGRATGYCGGHSGSLHISAKELGVVLTSTIVGGELALAPGVALAQKLGAPGCEPGGITTVFFGDGAACEGIFHEAVNLAVIWQLPLLFVCENNQWQAYVRRDETMPMDHVADWVRGHGLADTRVVDGNDAEAVRGAALEMAEAIRADGRPRFLELTTWRQRGHFEPDDCAYVDPAEHARWLARDPLRLLGERLCREGLLDDAGIAALQAVIDVELDAALSIAQAAPWPVPDAAAQSLAA